MTTTVPAPRPPAAPGAVEQVRAVLALRAAAVRGRARRPVAIGLAAIPVLMLAAALGGTALPLESSRSAVVLMPTAWLAFLVAVCVASGTSGARLLLPRSQSGPFPLTPAADHLGALLIAPLNVAWLAQTAGLLVLTGWAVGLTPALAGAQLVTITFVLVATAVAQTLGWLVELVRTTHAGPWLLRAVVAWLVAALAIVAATGNVLAVLDRTPTVPLVTAALGSPLRAVAGLGVLLAVAVLAHLAGIRLAALVARRPARQQSRVEARDRPARPDPADEFAAALRIDRAGVWRSAPLRRGLVALTAVPALAAAIAQLDWHLVAVLPGLVASGAGLLFGVNAMALDGSGAVWRESLPGSPNVLLAARMVVVAELCLAGACGTLLVATLRADEWPTRPELLAILAATVTTTAQVVAHCATWSVRRPYAAQLRDARDQPAPPAAMAAYSARLAVATTSAGLLFAVLAQLRMTAAIVFAAVAIVAFAARRTVSAAHRWARPDVRARVVATVAGG